MNNDALERIWKQYVDCVDVGYAHGIAMKLHPLVNSPLGGRNAGSDAEHQAAEMLFDEMVSIGLADLRKEWFPVVKWQFNDAILTVTGEQNYEIIQFRPYPYPSGATPAEGVAGELVYVNRGTKQDLMDVEVKGKVVLIDSNMREDWWITYPVLEAAFRGAAAVVCSCSGGFSMENEMALNCQDFVGPKTIPCVSISRKEADYLKQLVKHQKVTVKLWVDAQLDPTGRSCNLSGIIPGKNTEEQLIVGDHYDCHFWGFQDNNMAVGLTLAIAKAIIGAKIIPERTLVFILHGAEESGALDTRYDWSVGAWNQINHIRPEWVGKTLAYINFELPGYTFGNTNYTAAAPELFGLLETFRQALPEELRGFQGDPYETGFKQFSWSDDWSYTAAGVPGMVNGFLLDKQGGINDFFIEKYHSQFDDPGTYDEAMLEYHLKLYGCLALFLIGQPLWLLDFSAQINRIESGLSQWIDEQLPLEGQQYRLFLLEVRHAADKVLKNLGLLNVRALKSSERVDQASRLAVNQHLLRLFKRWQDLFLRLDWSDTPIVGHQHYLANCTYLEEAIKALKNDDGEAALNTLSLIEDEYISRYFSREVVEHFTHQVRASDRKDNQFWGTGRIVDSLDLFDIINSVQSTMGDGGIQKWAVEIGELERLLEEEKKALQKTLVDEMEGLVEIQGLFEDIHVAKHITRLMMEAGIENK